MAETEELADRLHSLAIHLLRRVRVADAESGLSAPRLSALSVLVFGGRRTVGELAEAEQVTAPSMSRLLAALEREGLVARSSDAKDGRRVVVSATARGRRVLEGARRRRVEGLTALLEGIERSRRGEILRAVSVLESTLEESG